MADKTYQCWHCKSVRMNMNINDTYYTIYCNDCKAYICHARWDYIAGNLEIIEMPDHPDKERRIKC